MGCRVSLINVLFPEPDTPVTTISSPSGKVTSTSFRLLPLQPVSCSVLPLPSLRSLGISILRSPFKYCAVSVCVLSMSAGVPWKTTSPPLRPAFGPMSTIQSAARIMSSSCSTTMTVFPMSRSSFSELIRRSLSR